MEGSPWDLFRGKIMLHVHFLFFIFAYTLLCSVSFTSKEPKLNQNLRVVHF